jgi:hypothetical protein
LLHHRRRRGSTPRTQWVLQSVHRRPNGCEIRLGRIQPRCDTHLQGCIALTSMPTRPLNSIPNKHLHFLSHPDRIQGIISGASAYGVDRPLNRYHHRWPPGVPASEADQSFLDPPVFDRGFAGAVKVRRGWAGGTS